MTHSRLLSSILTTAAVLGVLVAVVFTFLFGLVSGVSCAVGTALGMLNLWALARLVTIMLDGDSHGKRRVRAAILLGAKSIGLFALVGALLAGGWVRGGPLMVGLSVVAAAIVLGSVFRNENSLVTGKEGTDA